MRKTRFFLATVGLLGAGLGSAGCFDFFSDADVWLQDYPDTTTTTTTTTTSSGPSCEGDPTQDESVLTNDCGVFVKAGATGGDGTQETPFGSFVEAAKSGAERIFACAGDYAENEGVVLGGDVAVYGGFTGCDAAWKWSDEGRANILGPADVVAVTLIGGSSLLTNVDVTAADAQADGGSSIAVVVNGGTVQIANGELTSRNAKAGAAGESLSGHPSLNGLVGENGAGTCSPGATHPGPMGAVKACLDGSMSVAGSGGDGGNPQGASAGSGADGTPPDDAFPTFGQGGDGEGANGSPVCISGTDGAPGGDGTAADAVSGLGDVTEAGYSGLSGAAGAYGKPGQGGGGGGGSKGAVGIIECTGMALDFPGASGGAGGTGGCGGKGGGGGGAGGASIALVSLKADVTLTSVTLRVGSGGAGGVGGAGQTGGQKGFGGDPGAGANPADPSCRGGDGGAGGAGGPGSGGTGGHAVGIAFKGAAPKGGTVVMDNAAPGLGGDGGPGLEAAGKGSDGLSCTTLSFEEGAASCET